MSHLTRQPIDVDALVREVVRPGHGAVATFVGVVRDHADGRRVERIRYDAFEAMAEQELARIHAEIEHRWPDSACRIVHRLGLLELGEASVAVVVATPHRAESFDACRHGIERIKASVPIWKKEMGPDGDGWVEGTTTIDAAPRV